MPDTTTPGASAAHVPASPDALLAVVDLGSNSFRLEILRRSRGQLERVDYHKETVRQGGGLGPDGHLSPQALERGWDCLARFGQALQGFAPWQVRAVATQTLREARNRDDFLARGQRLLGFPIEVISGQEEARLIYRGVTQRLPASHERRLVLDVGGRSTELIVGSGGQARAMTSRLLGSVAWSMAHFGDERLSARQFERAEAAAQAVLGDAVADFGRPHWDAAYGCSGTVGAVADALRLGGQTAERHVVTRAGLHALRAQLIAVGDSDAIRLPGIKAERKAVIGGGVSVLCALFALLDIERLRYVPGALRHGALLDWLERPQAAGATGEAAAASPLTRVARR